MNINYCTFSGNSSGIKGGAVYSAGTGGNITISESTIYNNSCGSGDGGGIYVYDGAVNINGSTIAGNSAGVNGGGIMAESGATVNLSLTILANNVASSLGNDCYGTITPYNGGYNLIEDTAGCTYGASATDITGQDPLLGSFGDNGGPTMTQAPETEPTLSPAVNNGGGGCASLDQRGTGRPQEDACDIGAVELARYNLAVTNDLGAGTGSVSSSPSGLDCGETCNNDFYELSPVQLSAVPDTGSSFLRWDGDCSGTTPTLNLTLTADKSCDAYFDIDQHTLNISPTGNGSGSVTGSPAGINCGAVCNYAYDYGTTVTLTANAAADSDFIEWGDRSKRVQ